MIRSSTNPAGTSHPMACPPTRPRRARAEGLSLVEVVLATLLVGIMLVGAMDGVGSILRAWRVAEQRHDGLALAEQLMAEILQQAYEEPIASPLFGVESPEVGGDRSNWDDVDDYHNWSSSPEDASNNALVGYEGWNRAVQVVLADVDDPAQTSGSDEGLKRITVTVSDPTGKETVLDAYRSKWGVLQKAPDADSTLQTLITTQIEVNNGTVLQGGAAVVNHATDS